MTPETPPEVLNFDEAVKPKLPTGLNVLTILTFVGCAWELYSTVNNFIGGKKALEEMEKAQEKLAEAPAWARKLAGPEVQEMMLQSFNNKVPIFIIGLIAVTLCFYGALQMRKLKKEGYFLWLVGEILPFIGSVIFVPALFNTLFIYFSIFPLLFIILYTVQRKHLTK
ncbi:MAG: hypothetical protein IPO01_09885 [Chitinophagaceae bacterium]|nr:hypothetical protein [Chitinophagaceae bacterium]MBL0200091.1 hypothetical protein [Chitinophagaceae bacterium]